MTHSPARDAIHARIHGPGYCDPPCGLCREVEGLIDDFAHELAAKVRNFDGFGKEDAADSIDPYTDACGPDCRCDPNKL